MKIKHKLYRKIIKCYKSLFESIVRIFFQYSNGSINKSMCENLITSKLRNSLNQYGLLVLIEVVKMIYKKMESYEGGKMTIDVNGELYKVYIDLDVIDTYMKKLGYFIYRGSKNI